VCVCVCVCVYAGWGPPGPWAGPPGNPSAGSGLPNHPTRARRRRPDRTARSDRHHPRLPSCLTDRSAPRHSSPCCH
jgi:hypothetical protein